jgi:carbon monoxide dehydrogenase subunit G
MQINDSLTVTVDRERVWAFLMDIERLAQFGLTVVKGTAKKMTAQFGRCVQEALSEEALA